MVDYLVLSVPRGATAAAATASDATSLFGRASGSIWLDCVWIMGSWGCATGTWQGRTVAAAVTVVVVVFSHRAIKSRLKGVLSSLEVRA